MQWGRRGGGRHLPDDDHVDVPATGLGVDGDGDHGADVGVELALVPELHDGGDVPRRRGRGGRRRPEQRRAGGGGVERSLW